MLVLFPLMKYFTFCWLMSLVTRPDITVCSILGAACILGTVTIFHTGQDLRVSYVVLRFIYIMSIWRQHAMRGQLIITNTVVVRSRHKRCTRVYDRIICQAFESNFIFEKRARLRYQILHICIISVYSLNERKVRLGENDYSPMKNKFPSTNFGISNLGLRTFNDKNRIKNRNNRNRI